MNTTTRRELRLVVECRAAGLSDPFTAAVVDHACNAPSDAARAFAMAEAVQAVSGSPSLLADLLHHGASVEQFLTEAARHVVPTTWRLSATGDRAIRGSLVTG